jgi:hypothetical protein
MKIEHYFSVLSLSLSLSLFKMQDAIDGIIKIKKERGREMSLLHENEF